LKRTEALLAEIHGRLLERYGDPRWWPGDTPYEIITGAVLTQNTAWTNVKKAIANFGGMLSPEHVLGLEPHELAEIIRPAGYFNQKAGYLQTVTRWFGQYGHDADAVRALPQSRVRGELLALKGIGPETADDILLYAFGFPSFVVDAYTVRLAERLPLETSLKYGEVKAFFEEHLPQDTRLFNEYHALIVMNGNAHCRKKPSCNGCPLAELCGFGAG
jgi:endonuclease-3 related protein